MICRCVLGAVAVPCGQKDLNRKRVETEQNFVYRNIPYRLYPGSAATAKRLLRIWDACRFAWNEAKAAYELHDEHACGREIAKPTFMTFGPAFTELRKQHERLQEMPYTVVRHSLYYLAEAYKGFLKGERGHPGWQNRFRHPSFTIPQDVRTDGDTLSVPGVGKLKIQRRGGNPYPDGQAVKAVVKRVGRRWCAVILLQGGGAAAGTRWPRHRC